MPLVRLELNAPCVTITLDDPGRRNALSTAMFDALRAGVAAAAMHETSAVVRLRGNGPAFCAGFDLGACVERRTLLATFIRRLSLLNRSIRRLRQVVVVEVQGAALAGGCALLSACDFVCVAPDATLGYPVHRIGVSPAVSLPTLTIATGGAARPLTLGGDLIDGRTALRIGLATHCAESPDTLPTLVDSLVARLAAKGPVALAATKRWLNELDGSARNTAFDLTAEGSARLCDGDECVAMLASFWNSRKR
ncbi:MAG: enoyl-CoA hydratase/isomerase family protein [Phycisphaerae bacterium]|nr:enoyl-CoA hydratase/isomerase family protein [Phycisphaerae bacterium]